MSWGTNYKYEGVISRVGINELEQKLEETQTLLNGIREEMIALMAMSPPANGMVEDEDGGKVLWPQYVVRRLNCLWEELEELMCCSVRLQQALEVPIHQAAIVTEEAGELLQASLNHNEHKGSKKAMITEAIHTAATVIRFLKNIEESND